MNPLVRSNAMESSGLSLWAQIRQDSANQSLPCSTSEEGACNRLKRGVDSVDEDVSPSDSTSSTPILSGDEPFAHIPKKSVQWFDDGKGNPTFDVKTYSKADIKNLPTEDASTTNPTSDKKKAQIKLQHFAGRVIAEYIGGNYELNSREGFRQSTNPKYRATHQIVSLRVLIAKSLDDQDMLDFCELLGIFKNNEELDARESAELLALFQKIDFDSRSAFAFNLNKATLANLKSKAGIT